MKFQVMLNHFQEAFIITAKKAYLSIIWQSHLCLQTPTHIQEDFAIIKAWQLHTNWIYFCLCQKELKSFHCWE